MPPQAQSSHRSPDLHEQSVFPLLRPCAKILAHHLGPIQGLREGAGTTPTSFALGSGNTPTAGTRAASASPVSGRDPPSACTSSPESPAPGTPRPPAPGSRDAARGDTPGDVLPGSGSGSGAPEDCGSARTESPGETERRGRGWRSSGSDCEGACGRNLRTLGPRPSFHGRRGSRLRFAQRVGHCRVQKSLVPPREEPEERTAGAEPRPAKRRRREDG